MQMSVNLRSDSIWQADLQLAPDAPKPKGTFGFLLHDYQTTYWREKRGIPLGVHRGYPDKKRGQPETVNPNEKEDVNRLTQNWREWYKQFWCYCCFGDTDLYRFPEIEGAFLSAMASNRVITNDEPVWYDGYMSLAMGGNIVRIKREGRPNQLFGMSWVCEALNSSRSPEHEVEDVYHNMPWLWSRATNSRYQEEEYPDGDDRQLLNRWQHVIPFPQAEPWNSHTPLMLISKTGEVNIMQSRVAIMTTYQVPNPCNPYTKLRPLYHV